MDFFYQNTDIKGRNLDVLWLGMVMPASQIKFIEFMNKILT